MSPTGNFSRATAISAILVFSFLTALYSITYSGTYRVDDEHVLMARAQSLALWGDFSNPQVYGNDRIRQLASLAPPFAAQAISIEPAQTFLGALLYRWGRANDVGGSQAAFTLNIYATAFTGAVVLLTVCVLGFDLRTATWCALLFGVGTMAWPYAKTFYRDSLAMLMVAIAFLGWAFATNSQGGRKAISAALMLLAVFGGILTKNTAAILVPAFGLTLLIAWIRQFAGGWRLWSRLGAMALASALLVGFAAALPAEGSLARFSLTYYTSLGRHFAESFNRSSLMGTLGPFLSPAKSILLFSPPLVLSVYAGVRWWRRHWLYATPAYLAAVLLALAQALFYGAAWPGSFGWGLRYMLPALPPLMLAAAPAVEWLVEGKTAPRRWALASLFVLGVLVQVGGAFVSWYAAYDHWLVIGLNPFPPSSAWDLTYLAIPFHLGRILQPESWDLAWFRTVNFRAAGACVIVASASILLLISFLSLRRVGHDMPDRAGRYSPALLAGLALVLPLFPTLRILSYDPTATLERPEFQQALAWVEGGIEQEDVVVVDSYGTPLWAYMMQTWSLPVRWYSLPFEIPGAPGVGTTHGGPPSRAAIDLFETLGDEYRRLWYISSSEAPDSGFAREIGWLDREFTLRGSLKWQGLSTVEARLYEAPDARR